MYIFFKNGILLIWNIHAADPAEVRQQLATCWRTHFLESDPELQRNHTFSVRAVCFSDWKSTRVLIKKPLPVSHRALCPAPVTWWRWILRRTSGWSPLWRSGRSETSSTTFPWGNKLVWALVTAVCFFPLRSVSVAQWETWATAPHFQQEVKIK